MGRGLEFDHTKTLTKVAWVSMHDKNKIILSGLSGLKPVLLMYHYRAGYC